MPTTGTRTPLNEDSSRASSYPTVIPNSVFSASTGQYLTQPINTRYLSMRTLSDTFICTTLSATFQKKTNTIRSPTYRISS